MDTREHFLPKIERVPIRKSNAPVAGRASDRLGNLRAVDAAAFVVQLHPENPHGIVGPGGKFIEVVAPLAPV